MIVNITGNLVIDPRSRNYHLNKKGELLVPWCKLPYHNHPKGCPNYGKRDSCPPKAPPIEDFFDLDKELWFAVIRFNLKNHMERMWRKHPDWSTWQAKCVLYWQGKVRKQLKHITKVFCRDTDLIYTNCPEAMGVHVIKTAQKVGIPMVKNPTYYTYHITMIGYPKEENEIMFGFSGYGFY